MNMGDLMKQAQQFQAKLSDIQQELGKKTVTGSAGAGMVTATVNGNSELLDLHIEPGIVNADDVQMLEDLVTAAVNDGLQKAKEVGKTEMGKLTGGVNIPGLF
ncbi:YbaB/EbfC family nucleoid-associated protein [Desulfogranum marinum]|jgi:DNA-binding YbaB/EbfC family protein|uniref:YbaB/EbfC family nucleoid-associated protein n=1 Tax=Desulfogranum marinum TaxID=453220 RepID=UPI0019634045|nr:YbaB/EbfC family nucleoid-associated protein [Desulfogranum marinum]MBM9513496.1 YbaB/EbfC family nucleoid-associated protein [Desulfogranum marinum]